MDPTTTLEDLFWALRDGDEERIKDTKEALGTWLLAGGFAPDVLRAIGVITVED